MKKYIEKWGGGVSLFWKHLLGIFYFFTFKSQQLPNSLKCSNPDNLNFLNFFFLYQQLKTWEKPPRKLWYSE